MIQTINPLEAKKIIDEFLDRSDPVETAQRLRRLLDLYLISEESDNPIIGEKRALYDTVNSLSEMLGAIERAVPRLDVSLQ